MFEQVNVPILGIIENMSGFICQHCGKGDGYLWRRRRQEDGCRIKRAISGSIPLDTAIMSSGEDGVPVLARDRESTAAKSYISLAGAVEKQIDVMKASGNLIEPEHVELVENGELHMRWPDGHRSVYTPYHLRVNCRCANCIDENTGLQTLDPVLIPLDIKINDIKSVGRYAIALAFSDGHNTGIYTFKRLRELCECPECT